MELFAHVTESEFPFTLAIYAFGVLTGVGASYLFWGRSKQR